MGVGLLQPWHLIIILVVVLIIFGAGRLPEVGGALGKGIKEFKEAKDEDVTPAEKAAAAPRQPIQTAKTAPLNGGRAAKRSDVIISSDAAATRADEV